MKRETLEKRWEMQGAQWRQPSQVIGAWWDSGTIVPGMLGHKVKGPWWDILEEAGITLLVTREYEHLVVAMRGERGGGRMSYLPLPHPSGLAVDRKTGRVMVASTRNPNQVVELRPMAGRVKRGDVKAIPDRENAKPLLPTRTWFYPGSLYMHDLAFIGGKLHANAVGHNAVVRLEEDGTWERVWWPKSVEGKRGAEFGRNHVQLNSIAAGASASESFYSATSEKAGKVRIGDPAYEVDGRGVIFSGAAREVMCRGLTRPHSARLLRGKVWVDNSGYGEVGFVKVGKLEVVAKLPGWTRGLSFCGKWAFVGTSRVLPRYHRYAPGLEPAKCVCAVHAVEVATGKVGASVEFATGNQLFAIEWLPSRVASGLPFTPANAGRADLHSALFYAGDAGLLQET